jgi:sporulation protein YlmC with PRC-barrel domain
MAPTHKLHGIPGWIITIGILALHAPAAEPPTHDNYREVQPAVAIIGMEVKDSRNRTLGRVKELALDLENGRIVEVIVSSGGFLGMGQRTVGVPPRALLFDPAIGEFQLNVSSEKFKAAPEFVISKWAENCTSGRVAEAYRYFGEEPYFAADGQKTESGNSATEPLGHIERSSKLIDFPIMNLRNEFLGRVSTFLYSPRSGRVLHVIVRAPGSRQTKSAIPARALRFNAAHDVLYFDITTEAFNNEPRFKWVLDDSGNFQQNTYSDFQQETYSNTKVAANDGVNTRQNVRDGIALTYTPLAQGANHADMDRTSRIYASMRAVASLSQNAQDVEVGTLHGRVTLRGHVNNEEGKRVVGEIAGSVGRPENVSNLLEVRPHPPR